MKGRHPVSARIDVGAPGVYPIGGGLAASVRIDEFLFRRNWGGGIGETPPMPVGLSDRPHQARWADFIRPTRSTGPTFT